jgi:sulfite exporter TauE/SafE
MVGTILPIVYGARANERQPTAHVVHAFGSAIGAGVIGATLALVGRVLLSAAPSSTYGPTAAGVAGTVAALYVWHEIGVVRLPMPQVPRQVPASWRFRFAPTAMSLAYGVVLGAGVFTHVWTASFYVLAVWVALTANPLAGGVALAAFGLARAIPVLVLGRRRSDVDEAFRLTWRLDAWSGVVHLVNGVLLAALAGFLLVASVSGWSI